MKKVSFIVLLLIIVAGFIFLFFSPAFERIPPTIKIENNGFWNLKKPLKIYISDNTGLKYYKIYFDKYVISKKLNNNPKDITVNFTLPNNFKPKGGKYLLKVEAIDKSGWNFWAGNFTRKEKEIVIDRRKPVVTVISHSYGIGRGGAALIVYKAIDKNLTSNLIVVNNEYRFKSFPFLKKDYFISLISWPVKEKSLEVAIVVNDKAGNITKSYVSFYKKKYSYAISKIKLNKNFLFEKVKTLLNEADKNITGDFISDFKAMNENLRFENETKIENIAKNFPIEKINNFKIKIFHPLKNAAKKAGFGDHRFYYFGKEQISESWHLGIDLASIKNAPIILSNKGKVVYANYTGIYGNVIIVYHGLGLFSLYAHCSNFLVHEGDILKAGTVIARTGATGAVFGDHLHFGILIQGIESQPIEWFDKHWLEDNIFKVIEDAKEIINVSYKN